MKKITNKIFNLLLLLLIFISFSSVVYGVNPTVTEVNITPSIVYDDSNIWGYANFTDADGDFEQGSQYKWYVNNNLIEEGTSHDILFWNFESDLNTTDKIKPIYTTSIQQPISNGIFGGSFNVSNNTYFFYNSSFLNLTKGSLMFWVNFSRDLADYPPTSRIFAWYADASNYFEIRVSSSSPQLSFHIVSGGTNYVLYGVSATFFNTTWKSGELHHFSFTWNNLSQTSEMYYDGLQVLNYTYVAPIGADADNNLSIFYRYGNQVYGIYDDMLISDDYKGEEEIWDYYSAKRERKQNEIFFNYSNFNVSDNITFSFQPCDNSNACGSWINSTPIIVSQRKPNVTINFSNQFKVLNFKYAGLKSGRYVKPHYDNSTVKQALVDLGLPYHWVDLMHGYGDWGEAVYPLREDGSYNFTSMEKMINVTRDAGATPIILFSCVPSNLTNATSGCSNSNPPDNITKWGDYVYNTTRHICELYGNASCEQMYFSFINEPNANPTVWFGNDKNYTLLYNESANRTKDYNPNLRVGVGRASGMYSTRFGNSTGWSDIENMLSEIKYLDFFGMTQYAFYYLYTFDEYKEPSGNNKYTYSKKRLLEWTNKTFDLYSRNISNLVTKYFPNTELWINTEYNIHTSLDYPKDVENEFIHSDFQKVVTASAIKHLIDSNSTMFTWFTLESSNNTDSGQADGVYQNAYGMYYIDNLTYAITKYPAYDMYKDWIQYFPNASTIYTTTSTDNWVEVLSTDNYIALINKRDAKVNISLNITGKSIAKLQDMNNASKRYNQSSPFYIELESYEVKFLGQDCITPVEDELINISTTLCQGTYYLNDTDTDGAIIIGANNIILDCNGASLIGNFSGSSIGIQSQTRNNVTFQNCIVTNYANNIRFAGGTFANITNNTIGNASTSGILCSTSAIGCNINNNNISITNLSLSTEINGIKVFRAKNTTIQNNNIHRGLRGIYIVSSNNTLIDSNFINASNGSSIHSDSSSVGFLNVINTITNNQITCYKTNFSYSSIQLPPNYVLGIHLINITNSLIDKNNISWCVKGIESDTGVNNLTISYNNLNYMDRAIHIGDSNDTTINNNNIYNATLFMDAYGIGINLFSKVQKPYVQNVNIFNNSIKDYGSVGISIRRSKFISISNNSFDEIPLSRKNVTGRCSSTATSNGDCDRGESVSAIRTMNIRKGWTDNNGEENNNQNFTLYHSNYSSSNITLSGNTFGNDVQILFWNEGGFNITHDLINYWYRKLRFPQQGNDWLTDFDEFYINNDINELRQFEHTQGGVVYSINNNLRKFYTGDDPQWNMTYKISKTRMIIKNTHPTIDQLINLTNLTDQSDSQYVQIFNQTSTTPAYENVNSANMTIPPNNRTLVFSHVTNTQPKFSEIATTITDVTYNFDSTETNMSFDCTGIGDIKVTNLNKISGIYGYVEIRHNGTRYTYTNADTYTTSVCSNWQFITSDYTPLTEVAGASGGSEGARGGGCDVYADTYKKCFYVDLLTSECKEGCLEGYICNDIYRCAIGGNILLLGKNKTIDLKLFSNKIQETDILSIGVVLSLILILIFLFGNKLGKKEEEEVEK